MKNDLAKEIIGSVKSVTKDWTRQRKQEERNSNAVMHRQRALIRSRKVTLKDAAYDGMETAYKAASGLSGMANPWQVFYRARPPILERTRKEDLDSMYFCQTLLVDYMIDNPRTTASWDIIWDDRGHFREPHTGRGIGIGTLAVRRYISRAGDCMDELEFALDGSFPTFGPRNRFQAVLFIEKEGFLPLFEAVHLAEKYDLAIMSSKGLSVGDNSPDFTSACNSVADIGPIFSLPSFV